MASAELVLATGMLTVTFDQSISPGSISFGQFVARPSANQRYRSNVFIHGGGSVVGPMTTTFDSALGATPTVDFRDVPSGEVSNPTSGAASQELGFPLTVI